MKQQIFDSFPKAEWITSRTNSLIVSLSKLSSSKHRKEQGLFLAEGIKLSEEAAGLSEIRYILVRCNDGILDGRIVDVLRKAPPTARVLAMPDSIFEKISTEKSPEGIITVLSTMNLLHKGVQCGSELSVDGFAGKRILAVDSIQDPGNLGTIIRTASAFGYTCVLLGGSADIYHPRAVRASMGAIFRMQVYTSQSLASCLLSLKESGHRVISAALAEDTFVLGDMALCADDCIVIGNEGHGVSPAVLAVSDAVLRIPMAPRSESLNAAGAASVLMWEYFRTFG